MESTAYPKRTTGGYEGGIQRETGVEESVPPAPLYLGVVSASANDFNIFRMFLALFPLIADISREVLNDGLIARLLRAVYRFQVLFISGFYLPFLRCWDKRKHISLRRRLDNKDLMALIVCLLYRKKNKK